MGIGILCTKPGLSHQKTVANINMDGLNWYGKTKDIIVVGQGQSELEDYLKEEAAKVDRVISYEFIPKQALIIVLIISILQKWVCLHYIPAVVLK